LTTIERITAAGGGCYVLPCSEDSLAVLTKRTAAAWGTVAGQLACALDESEQRSTSDAPKRRCSFEKRASPLAPGARLLRTSIGRLDA
jgi:hypothetical protein